MSGHPGFESRHTANRSASGSSTNDNASMPSTVPCDSTTGVASPVFRSANRRSSQLRRSRIEFQRWVDRPANQPAQLTSNVPVTGTALSPPPEWAYVSFSSTKVAVPDAVLPSTVNEST